MANRDEGFVLVARDGVVVRWISCHVIYKRVVVVRKFGELYSIK